jgi:hypothetical protein
VDPPFLTSKLDVEVEVEVEVEAEAEATLRLTVSQSVSQYVLVSGTPLELMTRFNFFLSFARKMFFSL